MKTIVKLLTALLICISLNFSHVNLTDSSQEFYKVNEEGEALPEY